MRLAPHPGHLLERGHGLRVQQQHALGHQVLGAAQIVQHPVRQDEVALPPGLEGRALLLKEPAVPRRVLGMLRQVDLRAFLSRRHLALTTIKHQRERAVGFIFFNKREKYIFVRTDAMRCKMRERDQAQNSQD